MNGYLCTYKGIQKEIYANTKYEAHLAGVKAFGVKPKHSHKVDTYLCELEGKEVTQTIS